MFEQDLSTFLATKTPLELTPDHGKSGHTSVASRPIRKGETILSIPALHYFSPAPPETCTRCLKQLASSRARCSQCRSALYCSSTCLSAHWRQRHHLECTQQRPQLDTSRVKPLYKPWLQMLLGVHAILSTPAKKPRWLRIQTAAWDQLTTHKAQTPQYLLAQYSELSSVAGIDGTDMLCKFGCNNFTTQTRHGAPCHICSPLASLLFNHSCTPNAVFAFDACSATTTVVAACDIAERTEVSVAYVDAMTPRGARTALLRDVYFFECSCPKCSDTVQGALDVLMDRTASELPRRLPRDFSAHCTQLAQWVVDVVECKLDNGGCFERMHAAVRDLDGREFSFAAYGHWRVCFDEAVDVRAWAWACVAALHVVAFYFAGGYFAAVNDVLVRQCVEAAKVVWNASVECVLPAGVDVALARGLAVWARGVCRDGVVGDGRFVEWVEGEAGRLLEQIDGEE